MGQAKRRGTPEERKAAAQEALRQAEERAGMERQQRALQGDHTRGKSPSRIPAFLMFALLNAGR